MVWKKGKEPKLLLLHLLTILLAVYFMEHYISALYSKIFCFELHG